MRRASVFVVGALVLLAAAPGARAQQTTTVCANGVEATVVRFEWRDGRYFLYRSPDAPPLDLPATGSARVNGPCESRVAGAGPGNPEPAGAGPQAGAKRFGVHGSNTIGERLMPALIDAHARLRLNGRTVHRRIDQEREEIDVFEQDATPSATIDLLAKGSGTAPTAFISGAAEIGMMSRPAKEDEREKVKAARGVDLFDGPNQHFLALDGLAIIVHPENPLRQVSVATLAQIFSGAAATWRDVDDEEGAERPIHLHVRDANSGTLDTFKGLVLAPSGRSLAAGAIPHESSEELAAAVAADPDAIGFVSFSFVRRDTRALPLASSCGLVQAPSKFAIKTEEYPFTRRLFLYSLGTPKTVLANDLLTFSISEDAQPTVLAAKAIDKAVELETRAFRETWAQAYRGDGRFGLPPEKSIDQGVLRQFLDLAGRTRRSSIVFRFEKGRDDLDVRARDDVQRLARYVEKTGATVYLVGFADSAGGWPQNYRLSRARAQRIREELRNRIAIPDERIVPMSYLAPVACNGAESEGRNRRVEVWVQNRT